MSRAWKFHNPEGLYFVSFATVGWVDVFTRSIYKEILVDSLKYCTNNKGLVLHAWVIMSNHVHLIISAQEGYELSGIVRDFKKYTSKLVLQAIEQNDKESSGYWPFSKRRVNTIAIMPTFSFGDKTTNPLS